MPEANRRHTAHAAHILETGQFPRTARRSFVELETRFVFFKQIRLADANNQLPPLMRAFRRSTLSSGVNVRSCTNV
jgi:hypothetical protein